MFTNCIIMAGGSGTRLWPASNSRCPKQFLTIPGGGTFFQAALERAFAVIVPEGKLIIVTGASHVPHVVKACSALPESQRNRVVVIPEPVGKNTAPAIACAVSYLAKTGIDGTENPSAHGTSQGPVQTKRTALVLTSDHIIGPLKDFVADALAAAQLAASGYLVIFGIPPTRPETGFGYIEADTSITALDARAFHVTSFREKPDLATARTFLARGSFYWNSGMFAFDVDFMLAQFRQHAPETLAPYEALPQIRDEQYETRDGVALLSRWPGLPEAYQTVKSISIDYAIAEKCSSVAMVAARFNWTDVGSWDEYAKVLEQDGAAHNTDTAPVFTAGSSNCFVNSDIPVALCAVEDLIVVVRSGSDGGPPSVLICKKGESQQVKTIVEEIRRSNRGDLL